MQPEEWKKRYTAWHNRVTGGWKRLEMRVERMTRDMVLKTALFHEHPELQEPDVFVRVFPQFVLSETSLNDGQYHILPVTGRTPTLNSYADELRAGFERIASELHLEIITGLPSPVGYSQPVMVANTPSGYIAVFRRTIPDEPMPAALHNPPTSR